MQASGYAYMLKSALIAAVLLLGCFGCASANPVPEFYLGRLDDVAFRVPSKFVMVSVKYKGEDDWSPPLKPPHLRTLSDPIGSIEFFVSRSRPGEPQSADHAFAESSRLRFSGPGTHHGWFGVTAMPIPPGITIMAIDKNWRNQTITWVPQQSVYGLHVARSTEPNYNSTFDTKYLDVGAETIIICSNTRMVVAPFTDTSTCNMYTIDRSHKAMLDISIDRGDLPNWPQIRQSAIDVLESFTIHAAGKRQRG